MRYLFVLCVLLLMAGEAVVAEEYGFRVAVDFEERPLPDLSKIANVYHGDTRYVYAFAVIKGHERSEEEYASAYDIGYRLVSPDASVVNHGFYRLDTWESLSASSVDFPEELNLPGARLPAAVGYWKLELKKGRKSRAELQITPNPINLRSTVTLVDGSGRTVTVPTENLSQDVTCNGLINREFFHNQPHDIGGDRYVPGKVIGSFMPGVIEMDERWGSIDQIRDPGLRRVAEVYGLTGIKRLSRHSVKIPSPVMSRTGNLFTPINRWDIYVLTFSERSDFSGLVNAVHTLPRCIYAEPDYVLEPTGSTHVPNDSLAGDSLSWHLYRINMPSAWDREIGNEDVRIGVVDGGVDWHLEEFGDSIGEGFKTAGGYDYAMDDDDPRVEWGDDCEPPNAISNHGNWMQSVLGALTNNDSVGVAGVAGGWGGYEGQLGPSIYHFKIRKDKVGSTCGSISSSAVAEAIGDAYPDYGCQVLSVSVTGNISQDLKGKLRDFHNYGGVLVATTGNDDTDVKTHYPAYYRNDWVLCAQGSSRHPIDENDTTPERRVSSEDPLYDWGANWPKPYWPIPKLSIDVCAPASHMCHIYADELLGEKPLYYTEGEGVSFAPPQVAGVVGLMLATNEHLKPAEIEGLVSASCADITSDDEEPDSLLRGWDKYTGWGRIDADSCLLFADFSDSSFTVYPFRVGGGGVIVDSSETKEYISFLGEDGPLDPGMYHAKRYEVRRAVTPPSGYRFAWGRPCDGAGWSWSGTTPYSDYFNFQEPYCDLVPTTQYAATCTLFSYIYEVWNWSDSVYFGVLPDSAHLLDWSYGVIYEGVPASVATETVSEKVDMLRILAVAPNPGKGEVRVSFQIPTAERVGIKIYDVRGREVRTILDEKLEAGTHETRWDARNNSGKLVAPGVYVCRVATAHQYDTRKVLLIKEGGN